MAISQYLKRKQKAETQAKKVSEAPVENLVNVEVSPENTLVKSEPIVVVEKEVVFVNETVTEYTHEAMDVYYDDVDRKHKYAIIKYNPATGVAKVQKIGPIQRLIGLQFDSQKQSLKTLARK